ncbi:hypothetical protein NEIRO03_2565, partial [Nematocida sp. AWRm78]
RYSTNSTTRTLCPHTPLYSNNHNKEHIPTLSLFIIEYVIRLVTIPLRENVNKHDFLCWLL